MPPAKPFTRQPSSGSLLKQALANRITPMLATTTSSKPQQQHDGGGFETMPSTSYSNNTHEVPPKRDSLKNRRESDGSEMSKSILTNPAWYRDHEGKTGFKPAGVNKGVKESAEIKEVNKSVSYTFKYIFILTQCSNSL